MGWPLAGILITVNNHNMAVRQEITGKYINEIFCVQEIEPNVQPNGRRTRKGEFVCPKCGGEFIAFLQHISGGRTVQCKDCLSMERSVQFSKHGLTDHRMFNIWQKMKDRCYNPNNDGWQWYGGKGITVCDQWKDDFISFYDWSYTNGYADALTIDRIDGNKGYSPDNCRWTTMSVQSRNKGSHRDSTSKYVGVSYIKSKGKWRAQLRKDYISIYDEVFTTEIGAAIARDRFIIKNDLRDYNLNVMARR